MTTPTSFPSIPRQTGLLITGLALAALAGCAAKSVKLAEATAPAAASAPAATPATAELTWATFGPATATTAQGGYINTFSYSEKPGDVAMDALAINGDMVQVRGNFVAKSGSAWGGMGVSIEAGNNQPIDASGYKALRIRLAAPNGGKLRLRLNGTDIKVRDSGCFPSFTQTVTAKDTVYVIPFSRFSPEAYCGAKGATVSKTLPNFAMVEVADTSDPVKARASNFSIGAIALLP
ncbi:MAG: hypothetical protein QE279_03835 [Rhodoferax sp.]|nr:hypothetical protein [Rhodoferax sp.]